MPYVATRTCRTRQRASLRLFHCFIINWSLAATFIHGVNVIYCYARYRQHARHATAVVVDTPRYAKHRRARCYHVTLERIRDASQKSYVNKNVVRRRALEAISAAQLRRVIHYRAATTLRLYLYADADARRRAPCRAMRQQDAAMIRQTTRARARDAAAKISSMMRPHERTDIRCRRHDASALVPLFIDAMPRFTACRHHNMPMRQMRPMKDITPHFRR